MSDNCTHQPPTVSCNGHAIPGSYVVTIGPVLDTETNRTFSVQHIGGKWWMIGKDGAAYRELTAEETRQLFGAG
jgi:hypothetical protein